MWIVKTLLGSSEREIASLLQDRHRAGKIYRFPSPIGSSRNLVSMAVLHDFQLV